MKWFLIENNSHNIYEFSSLKELKKFAKANNLKIRQSPTTERCYYTESYVYAKP